MRPAARQRVGNTGGVPGWQAKNAGSPPLSAAAAPAIPAATIANTAVSAAAVLRRNLRHKLVAPRSDRYATQPRALSVIRQRMPQRYALLMPHGASETGVNAGNAACR